MCTVIRRFILLSVALVSLTDANPILSINQSEDPTSSFLLSLHPIEQAALMDMVVRPSEIVTLDDENGVQTLLTRLVIPDVSIRRVQETTDYEFKGKLVSWISQLWSLSKHSQNDLLTTGSGCGPQTCLSITNLSSIEVCCPFG